MIFFCRNYVVQHIIAGDVAARKSFSGDVAAANAVEKQLLGNFCQLSMQQAASHVVETCLTCAGKEELRSILADLTSSPSFGELLVHQYGNYVAQKAIKVTKVLNLLKSQCFSPFFFHNFFPSNAYDHLSYCAENVISRRSFGCN